MVHLQDRALWTPAPGSISQEEEGGWVGGGSGHQNQRAAPLNLRVFEWLGKQRLEVTPTAYMKCICNHYSGLSAAANTRGLTLAVVSGRMCILSLNPVTKGLFVQINSLLVWYLTLGSSESTWTQAADSTGDTQIPSSACMTRYAPLKNLPLIVRGNKAMHMQSGDV